MTDQDWEVDGANGGAAGESSSAGATRADPEPSASHVENVVPFPGNWFGSVDELVPVHPQQPTALVEVPASAETAGGPAADASDFWEGDAATLEEVPASAAPAPSIALLRSPGAGKRRAASASAEAEVTDGADRPAAGRARSGWARSGWARSGWARSGWARSGWARSGWQRLSLVGLVAAAAAVLVVTNVLPIVHGAPPARDAGHATALRSGAAARVTHTITSTVTVTTRPPARTRRHRSAKPRKLVASHHAASQGGSTRPPTTGGTDANKSVATPVVTPSHSSSASGSSGAGCVQSPDSGCLP